MLFMKEHSGRNGFMIKLDNIRKTYPGSAHAAIRGLNLVINSGELCTFVGPSGCGKTTILRMINQRIFLTPVTYTFRALSLPLPILFRCAAKLALSCKAPHSFRIVLSRKI